VRRDGDRVIVANGLYELTIGPDTGGLIDSLAVNGQTLLAPTHFGTASRRLWLGGDVAFGPGTLQSVTWQSGGEGTEVMARGVVTRALGGRAEPALDYQAAYYCSATSTISCTLRLTPRVDIEGVLGSLATTLAFPGATRWAANTFEGLLYDDLIPRRLDDQPYHSMCVRPHSNRLFSSESLPLDPQRGFIAAEWPDGTVLRVSMRGIRGWGPGESPAGVLKERLRDDLGLHAQLMWADGSEPLTLQKDQTYELSYTLDIMQGGEAALAVAAALPVTRRSPPPIGLRAAGSRYLVETPTFRAAMCRSQGGSLVDLALKGAGAKAVAGTNVYSDYGIYGDWTDPSGGEHRTTALSNLDIECVPSIDRQPDRLRLTFEGLFRDANWSGRPIPEPRTQYRVTYEFTTESVTGTDRGRSGLVPVTDSVVIECSARPNVTRQQVKAFLAQPVSLPYAGPWAVYKGDPPQLIASGKPPGPGDRVWQSASDPLTDADAPRVLIERPGPVCVEFSEFEGLSDVQNLFYLQGNPDSTLFVAFLDGQPKDLDLRWLRVRYRITLHRGALSDVLNTLGLPGD